MDRPRLVGVGDVERAAPPPLVQSPPRAEELVERRALPPGAGADHDVARRPRAGVAQAGVVGVHVAAAGVAHPGPPVGQPEGRAGAEHHGRAVGVQAEEDDAATARLVDRVEAHVGLEEGAEVGHARAAGDAGVDHAERDQPDVGRAVEGVGPHARRHPVRDLGRVDCPVQEGQVAPVLVHHHRAGQRRRVRGDGLDDGVAHAASVGSGGKWRGLMGHRLSAPSTRVGRRDAIHDLGAGAPQVVR